MTNHAVAYLVDSNAKAANVIRKNIEKIAITEVTIWNMDYQKALDELKKKSQKVDIIFLDPPYQTNYIEESLKTIDQYELLAPAGIIVCESDDLKKIVYSKNFVSVKEKKYGDKHIVILKKI